MEETAKIWMNGELVDWADATVHVGVHGLHYGSGVFGGVRASQTRRWAAGVRVRPSPPLRRGPPHRDARPGARERPAVLLSAPDRVLRLRVARRPHERKPRRDRDH